MFVACNFFTVELFLADVGNILRPCPYDDLSLLPRAFGVIHLRCISRRFDVGAYWASLLHVFV